MTRASASTVSPLQTVRSISLGILMEPVSKGRPRFVRTTGRTFTPKQTMRAETAIQAAWKEAGAPRLPAAPLSLEVIARFARPESHYLRDGSLSASGRRAIPGGGRDFDNIAKTVTDALNRLAWPDDRYICRALVVKEWARRGDSPAVLIGAETMEEAHER